MRQIALGRGLAAMGAGAALCAAAPAWANSAVSPAIAPVGEAAPLVAHYDTASRILFIGANPQASATTDNVGHVTFSRTADLVGRQLRLVWNPRIGSGRFGPGTLPNGMPVAARAMTSGFGLRAHPMLGGWRAHSGVDLAAASGSPIVATSDGTVGKANWNGGYGLFVSLEHGGGIETRYGHMSRLNVAAGQQVKKGQVIGYVGSTGRSTGPHLHYEVRRNGQAVNPAGLLGGR
jgi:murein DD-endopeptidase MepM/ murein hydrolase activator NlpD